jgi:hypothetical protein
MVTLAGATEEVVLLGLFLVFLHRLVEEDLMAMVVVLVVEEVVEEFLTLTAVLEVMT